MRNKILITNDQKKERFTLKFKSIIRKSVNETVKYMGYEPGFEVSVLITDNEEIKILNAEHRNIDKETDVLSFPMLEFDNEGNMKENMQSNVLGDIVISLEKAFCQAEQYGHSPEREVGFLTVHSMLHLFGFDHMEEEETRKMRSAEEEILGKMGVTR